MGALDELMFGGGDQRKAYDKFSNQVWLADTVNKQRMDEFSQTPLGVLMGSLAFAGPKAGPVPRLPPGGAPAPHGNYIRPSPVEPMPGANPVSGMQTYAETMPVMDPKMIAGRYQRMYPEVETAIKRLENPLHDPKVAPYFQEASGLLKRNQSAIDQLVNQDVWGPWGARP